MKLLVSITDFPPYVPFSVNIAPLLVEPYILRAQTQDVRLPSAIWKALETALDAVAGEFAPNEFDSAEFFTEAQAAGWVDMKLAALWYTAVRPLLVCHAARRMLLWHGLHITPNAAEITTDRPVSAAQRTEMRSDLQAQCSFYEAQLQVALRAYQPTNTNAVCVSTRRQPTHGGLKTSAV
jgi:hypothetical protein